MFKNSNELLEYALRELQVAINENKSQVEIVLTDSFPSDTDSVQNYCDDLEMKTITEILREEFKNYDISSTVASKGDLKLVISFKRGPCALCYPLVWTLTLRKK